MPASVSAVLLISNVSQKISVSLYVEVEHAGPHIGVREWNHFVKTVCLIY